MTVKVRVLMNQVMIHFFLSPQRVAVLSLHARQLACHRQQRLYIIDPSPVSLDSASSQPAGRLSYGKHLDISANINSILKTQLVDVTEKGTQILAECIEIEGRRAKAQELLLLHVHSVGVVLFQDER
jgi:hypothetical protein